MTHTVWAEPATLSGTPVPKMEGQRRSWLGDVALLAFLVAQSLDGALTYVGVTTFGIHAEANPIVAGMMTHLGHGAGLMGAKLLAGMLGFCLHIYEIHAAVAVLTFFYLVVAVAPWTMVLFF
jgi:hypothetical protein